MTMRAVPGHAALFVSNVLSRGGSTNSAPPRAGLCTVVRVEIALGPRTRPRMTGITVVGSRFSWRQDKAALVQGPTGLALGRGGTLYVASTTGSSISAIPDALTRTSPISSGHGALTSGGALNGPLGLTTAPDGDLIAVNGNNGNAVEITPGGRQVATVTLVPHGAGDLFGVTTYTDGQGVLFVNDGTNALDLFSA
jgi:DNA-binding beta-propeller fold protein YncE